MVSSSRVSNKNRSYSYVTKLFVVFDVTGFEVSGTRPQWGLIWITVLNCLA